MEHILSKFPEIKQFTKLQRQILEDVNKKKNNITKIALFLKAGKGKTILTRAILEVLGIKQEECIVVMTKNLLLSGAWGQFSNRLSKEQFCNTESSYFNNKYLIIDEIHVFKEKETNFYKRYETIQDKIKFLIGLTGTPAPQGDLDFLSLAKMFVDEKYIKSIDLNNYKKLTAQILNKLPDDKKYQIANFDVNIKILDNTAFYRKVPDLIYGKLRNIAIQNGFDKMTLGDFVKFKNLKDKLYVDILHGIENYGRINGKYIIFIEKSLFMKKEIRQAYKNMFTTYFNLYNDEDEEIVNYKRGVHTHILNITNKEDIDYVLANSLSSDKSYLAVFNKVFADYKIAILNKIIDNSQGQIVLWGYNKEASNYTAGKLGINYYTALSDSKRKKELENFHSGKNRMIFANPKSASEGLNWQFCQTAVFLSWDDNTKDFIQSIKRIDRMGQTKDITIHFIAFNIDAQLKKENIKLDKLFEKEIANNDWIKVDDLINFDKKETYYDMDDKLFYGVKKVEL
jgi:superfamily II DNA or RNA helicase